MDRNDAAHDVVVHVPTHQEQVGRRQHRDRDTGVGDLAQKRGITDWESNPDTWQSIGRGLGKAKVTPAELEAYEQSWAAGHPDRMQGIQKGYDAAR